MQHGGKDGVGAWWVAPLGAGERWVVLSLEWHGERDKAFQVKGGVGTETDGRKLAMS